MLKKLRKLVPVFAAAVLVLVLVRTDIVRLLRRQLDLSLGATGRAHDAQTAVLQLHQNAEQQRKQQEEGNERGHVERVEVTKDELAREGASAVASEIYESSSSDDHHERHAAKKGYSRSHHSSRGLSGGLQDQQEPVVLAPKTKNAEPATKSSSVVSSFELGHSRDYSDSEPTAGLPDRSLSATTAGKVEGKEPTGELHSRGVVGKPHAHKAGEQITTVSRPAFKADRHEAPGVSLQSNQNGSSMPASSSGQPSVLKPTTESQNTQTSLFAVTCELRAGDAAWTISSGGSHSCQEAISLDSRARSSSSSGQSGGTAEPQHVVVGGGAWRSVAAVSPTTGSARASANSSPAKSRGKPNGSNPTRAELLSSNGARGVAGGVAAAADLAKSDLPLVSRGGGVGKSLWNHTETTFGWSNSRADEDRGSTAAAAAAWHTAAAPSSSPEVTGRRAGFEAPREPRAGGTVPEGDASQSLTTDSPELVLQYAGLVSSYDSHLKISTSLTVVASTTLAAPTAAASSTRARPVNYVTSGQLTMNALAFTSRLFLISAYSDFRKNPPTVKIIIYAAKSFDERVYCVRRAGGAAAAAAHQATLSWINYPSEELALWRAGYLQCQLPDLTAQETSVELRRGGGGDSVRMPLGNAPPAAAAPSAFGLCVKSGYGAPSALRFIEWMELQSLLGVAHVFLYDLDLRGPIRSAMQHYVDSGLLTVVKDNSRRLIEQAQPRFIDLFAGFDATRATGDEPYSQLELLSIQDCFHRFRGLFEYIVVADIDEAIVPADGGTLHDLLRALRRRAPAATSFSHQSAAYLPHFAAANASGRTYMLAHTRRTEITWDGSKAFHSTADTESLNWHRRIRPGSNVAYVEPSEAWLHHYRGSCKGFSCDSNVKVIDDGASVLGKLATALTSRVAAVAEKVRGDDSRRAAVAGV